jgi:sterol desaturase/sphingolipid hydroxylase (fatty acid hydroxylase superfamily)
VSHSVPVLWRLHRVHHADTEMDVSTANRIHPLETLWVTFLRITLAVTLGIPIAAFIAFLIALNVLSIFNHANVSLPEKADRFLRLLFVTPNMHETHHSVHQHDYDTNFAFIFSFWDRVFKTYKSETTPLDGRIALGLDAFRSSEDTSFTRLLAMPLRNDEAVATK